MNQETMKAGIELLLKGMGVDLKDPNFSDTPVRVSRMYLEMLKPKPLRWKTFPVLSADIVLLRNHKTICLCPHHLLPVALRCFVGYIPQDKTVGLSKLARVVEAQLIRPITQEDLAAQVTVELMTHLRPKGVGVVLVGKHGCMTSRGVRTDGDVVVSVMRGVFLSDPAAKAELVSLMKEI